MEVWLLETYYSEEEQFNQILLHLPGTDYWFGCCGYEDYVNLESIPWTKLFWDSVANEVNDKLTYLGDL